MKHQRKGQSWLASPSNFIMDLTKLSPKERAIRMLIVAGFGTDLDEMDEYILKSILNQFSEEQLLNAFYNVFTPGD